MRCKIPFTVFIFLLMAGMSTSCLASRPEKYQPLNSSEGNWMLVADYSDEFDQPRLDLSKWKNSIGSWGKWSWDARNVSVNNGNLQIEMRYAPHERKGEPIYYTSGIVMSKKAPILYGYFEARIKGASVFPGVCPAFWAWHKDQEQWTEIDFVELTDRAESPRIIETNTHVFWHSKIRKSDPLHEGRHYLAPWDPRDDFHVYGCEWNAEEIKWYIDGKLVAARKNDYWHQPLDLTISMGLRWPLNKNPNPEGFPTHFEVDYVRVWKKG